MVLKAGSEVQVSYRSGGYDFGILNEEYKAGAGVCIKAETSIGECVMIIPPDDIKKITILTDEQYEKLDILCGQAAVSFGLAVEAAKLAVDGKHPEYLQQKAQIDAARNGNSNLQVVKPQIIQNRAQRRRN